MNQKRPIKVWHRVVAFLVGYVAAGITFAFLPMVLAYPFGRLTAGTLSPREGISLLQALAAFAAIGAWIFVYRYCIRNWWKEGNRGHSE